MGLCGWLASKMLRVPLAGTYHTDFPAYIDSLTGDHRIVNGAVEYFKVLYGQMDAVFTRSRTYRFNLRDIGVADDRMLTIQPGINTEKFHPRHRDETLFARLGVKEPRRVLYAGRVSVEKNLPLLVESFKMLAAARKDVALVVAGDGPYVAEMKTALKGLPHISSASSRTSSSPRCTRAAICSSSLPHRYARPGRHGSAGVRSTRPRLRRRRSQGNGAGRRHAA
jgi:glycosyltransferase involved in cell wall biosynthesis